MLLPAFAGLKAQVPTVLDGAYVKETNRTKRVIPYPSLRESDVMYTKRVWRIRALWPYRDRAAEAA